MNVAVIGMGYVGATMSVALGLHGHQVLGIDVDKEKIASFNKGIIPIYEIGMEENLLSLMEAKQITFSEDLSDIDTCQVVMIAVGTPASADGRADLSYIEEVAKQLGKVINRKKIIVIKSTVPVGTCDVVSHIIQDEQKRRGVCIPFEIVSNPEFLREGRALQDALYPERIVIGCSSSQAKKVMNELYHKVADKILFTSVRNSEMIKYASNAFLATKISFVNELARLTERVGADITEVARGMGMDSRIGEKFLHAGIGYGGSCFPKDTEALLAIGKDAEVELSLLQAVKKVNISQIKWFCQKMKTCMGQLQNKKIAVLGLTFKPNTDDIREAPALRILDFLMKNGAAVSAFDPKGMKATSSLYPEVNYCATPLQAIRNTEAIILATEWPEIVKLDWKTAAKIVAKPILFDGRNALNPVEMENWGYHYTGVGVFTS
jgi:UDPglucose 6-dehydrogenase